MIGFDEFNKKIMGMPGRKGSVVDYWNSLSKKELISLMEGQNLYIDLFMERGDRLEKKVNNLSRDKRGLNKEIRTLKDQYRWRDVKVELPEEDGRYLVLTDGRCSHVVNYHDNEFDAWHDFITHWMPILSLEVDK